MKLDVDALRYLSKDDFRVLTAVEMGMRNHELVPTTLIDRIAGLKHGGTYKTLKNLLKNKLVHHDASKYDAFRLTYLGYDFLAIKTLCNRGVFVSVGRQIGVGKESDIFEVANEDGEIMAMKLHRLGRTSFRAVKSKRDYLVHRNCFNWLYLSRLAALKEYAFMKALGEHGFPVPNAVDCNRHCVIMSLVEGFPLTQVKRLENPDEVFETIMSLVIRLAEHGLIHCDFNEFNIMIDDNEKVTMIDFPQMVSVSHRNAQMYFDRDVECIFKFFRKRFNISYEEDRDDYAGTVSDNGERGRPSFLSIEKTSGFLDKELSASGFTRKDQDDIEKFIEGGLSEEDSSSSGGDPEDEEQANEEGNGSLALDVGSLVDKISISSAQEEATERPCLIEEHEASINCNESEVVENATLCGPNTTDECGTSLAGDKEIDDDQPDGDAVFSKKMYRERRRVIAAARRGGRALASRNPQKDKGGKSSQNSKVQKQLCKWE